MDSYNTVKAPAADEFTERRSRFIGYICPVSTEEQAVEFINKKKSEHWDATHNVYAYILREGQTRRYSDDGEPSGTAGIPVLDVLQKAELTDVVVVVTRYFGGILLGGGGLVRAYSHAAALAVKKAEPLQMAICKELELKLDYTWYGHISRVLPKYNAQMLASDFGERVVLRVLVRSEYANKLVEEITELTAANVIFTEICEKFADIAQKN